MKFCFGLFNNKTYFRQIVNTLVKYSELKVKKSLFLLLLSLLIFSCSPEEKVINPIEESWNILVATDGLSPKLQLRSLPDNKVLFDDIFSEKLGITLKEPVSYITEFRNNLYLFATKENKIYVIKKSDYSKLAVLDFSAEQLQPTGITFPNATDAYISFNNSNSVTLVDITTFLIVKYVNTELNPIGIASSGNQIYVANSGSSTVSVLDSRTKNQESVINVTPKPSFVAITPNGLEAVVISVGSGKIDSLNEKTPAVATYIDIATRNIISSAEIGVNTIKAIDQIPIGFVSTPYNWGFVITKTNLFRLDFKTRDKVSSITAKDYRYITYSNGQDLLLLVRFYNNSYEIVIASPKTGIQSQTFKIGESACCVYAL